MQEFGRVDVFVGGDDEYGAEDAAGREAEEGEPLGAEVEVVGCGEEVGVCGDEEGDEAVVEG